MFYYIFNRNWVDTRWQQYSTHFHTNNTQNIENGTYITLKELNIYNNKKKLSIWGVRAVPRLCELYRGICLTTEEKARKSRG
jgi:hypothetical protein